MSISALRTDGPPELCDSPSADDGRATSTRVREAIIQLTRLVQRAAIYPQEHPSVRLALAPFLDALHAVTGTGATLLVVVLRDRLVASAGTGAPQEHESRWLASQLHARGVSSLTVSGALDAEELLVFARWITLPPQSGDHPPLPSGLALGWVDYSEATFEEAPDPEASGTPSAIAAWQRIATTLAMGPRLFGGQPPSSGSIDPEAIAAAIHAEIAESEGTGVSEASERVLIAGRQMHALGDLERRVVKKRLATVVANLPDEVRHQLLSVVPNDDPRKCELLTAIIDDLPQDRLLELVPRIDMRRGNHVSPFLTFLVRLCSVAAREATLSEAVEHQLSKHGLPTDLLHANGDEIQAILDQAFTQTVEQYASAGDLYQSRVHELTPNRFSPEDEDLRARYEEAANPRATSDHAARIAMALVRADPRDQSTVVCLTYARDAANRTLGEGRLSLLAELASVAAVVDRTHPDGATRAIVQECLALCRQPMALEQLVDAIGEHVGPPSETLTALFLAAGLAGSALGIARMADLPDGAFRDRLAELLARQDVDIVRSALTRVRRDGGAVMTVLRVLRQKDPLRTPDLVRLFIRDPEAAIRREAIDLLRDAPLSPLKRERVMIQALQDRDPEVVSAVLSDLCTHQTPGALDALTKYLSRVDDAGLEPLQLMAVQVFRTAWSSEAAHVLATALRARRHIFDRGPRIVSRAMITAIEDAGDEQARAAARAWRRSAAGLWSACIGGGGSSR